ncbi:MAG TPA: biopolymer transporter Tol [Microlunatus sp.]
MTQTTDQPLLPTRSLAMGQTTQVWVVDIDKADSELVYRSDELLLEAPNWAPDGTGLLLNGDGLLWRLELEPAVTLSPVPIDDLPPINNDHVVDPPRGLIYLSANDGHLYVAPIAGGTATRISHDPTRYHFLHGVSPDGSTLAFVDLPRGDSSAAGRFSLIPAAGGETTYPAAGSRHIDGPEYSADGAWIYLNTEEFGTQPGHAQLARVPATGGDLEQLVTSDTVDWFPHLSPDGTHATYITFPTGTLGHPADLDVQIHVVHTSDWTQPLRSIPLFGGQGTLNVNSWSPDGRRFAYVAYPNSEDD